MELKKSPIPTKSSIRKVIEGNVIAYNFLLREIVSEMNIIILLRNCHPTDRINFAYSLWKNDTISKDEAKEFVKIP